MNPSPTTIAKRSQQNAQFTHCVFTIRTIQWQLENVLVSQTDGATRQSYSVRATPRRISVRDSAPILFENAKRDGTENRWLYWIALSFEDKIFCRKELEKISNLTIDIYWCVATKVFKIDCKLSVNRYHRMNEIFPNRWGFHYIMQEYSILL